MNRTLPPTDEILGLELVVSLGGTGGPGTGVRLGLGSRLAGSTLADATDDAAAVFDGSGATGYGDTTASAGDKFVHVYHDLGAPASVDSVTWNVDCAGGNCSIDGIDWSSDGTTWTSLALAYPTGPVLASSSTRGFASRTARWWRIRVSAVLGTTNRARVNEFRLSGGGSGLTPGAAGTGGWLERLEVAWTTDGLTPTGEVRTFLVPPGGGIVVLGAVEDLWSTSLTPSLIDQPNFGILIRRSGSAGEAIHTDRLVDFAYGVVHHRAAGSTFMSTERTTVNQQILLGRETTRGTQSAPTVRLQTGNLQFQTKADFKEFRIQGDKLPAQFLLTKEMSEGSLDGSPTYNELGWWLSSALSRPQTSMLVAPAGGNPGVYRHVFSLNVRGFDQPNTFSIEYGDTIRAHRVTYALMNELQLTMSRSDISIGGSFMARRIVDGISFSPGATEVQTLTITGSPTGGSLGQLEFDGALSPTVLPFNATAAAMQTALQALSTVGAGNLLVSGTGPFTITAAGAFAGRAIPAVGLVGTALTGGTSPTATIAETTRGGFAEPDLAPIMPGHVSWFYAPSLATLAANKVTRGITGEWKVGGRWKPLWVMDSAVSDFAAHVEDAASVDSLLTVEADSNGMAMLADARANAQRYLRIQADGPVIAGGVSYQLQITQSVRLKALGGYDDTDGVYAHKFEVGAVLDPAWGYAVQVVLINSVAGY